MKAVILVGGQATRLLPLTCNTPKAMVPVLNTPFLEYVLRHLNRHGIKEVILAQGHLAQPIESYLGDGRQIGVRLYYSIEDTPLGTAGAIKNAERYLDDSFVALNGDIFTDLDITAMIDFHRQRKAKATIALTPVDDPTPYGLVETSAASRVTRFVEKPSPGEITTNMINAGAYILEPEILAQIPAQINVSIERETFPRLLAKGEPIYAYSSDAYWLEIGTPEKYFQVHRDLLGGKSKLYRPASDKGVLIGEKSEVHRSAQIQGPVMVGANCSIGPRVKLTGPVVIGPGGTILEDSVMEQSVIWRNVRIGPKATVKSSILADNCRLDKSAVVAESVLGDNVTVEKNGRVEPGSRVWPGTRVPANA